ncbi:hypothetical protein QR680_014557 [Steinernema hermaphroditum]|uniref:Uncharacterized protein n=1 Tax=Steinernema hermaphroditum TaxID=289476 RepID=A0AA39M492_9BILA|nr:hypothetical protein QR680_014557 [Steinernema hermaphroditum]
MRTSIIALHPSIYIQVPKYVMLAFDSLSIGVDFCTAYKTLSDYNEYRPIDMLYKGALILCCLYGVGLKMSQWKIRREHDGYKIALAGMRIRKISCKVDISLNNTSNGTKSTKSFSVLVKFKYIPERSGTTSVITAPQTGSLRLFTTMFTIMKERLPMTTKWRLCLRLFESGCASGIFNILAL